MYIVRRSFRGPNGPQVAGSVIEPAALKDFKYRLQQKHIVEVTEHNFERYKSFFEERFNVTIPDLLVGKEPDKEPENVKAVCPKCAVEFEVLAGTDKATVVCPACGYDGKEPEKVPDKEPEKVPDKEPAKEPVQAVAKAVNK